MDTVLVQHWRLQVVMMTMIMIMLEIGGKIHVIQVISGGDDGSSGGKIGLNVCNIK